MKGLSKDEIPCQVVIKTITKKPGLKDNNFQVSGGIVFETLLVN